LTNSNVLTLQDVNALFVEMKVLGLKCSELILSSLNGKCRQLGSFIRNNSSDNMAADIAQIVTAENCIFLQMEEHKKSLILPHGSNTSIRKKC
jgi:hypothetical protein